MKDKFCSNCGTKLKSREKRKPIPRELRHKVFVRDGYRCRECGKSNKETSLEIDHILPLSKGGPTTENNLWTLCRECNQAKKDSIWKDDEIEILKNALSNLENQLQESEENLKHAKTEEEEFALKAKIKDLKENKIPHDEKKLKELKQEEEHINTERKAQQRENERRQNLFNKLYVQVEGELLLEVCNHFSLSESTDKDNIKLLVSRYDEQLIYNTINTIKQELEEESNRKELYNKLYNKLSNNDIKLFQTELSIPGQRENIINYLINKFNEEEIESQRKKLKRKKKYNEFEDILNRKDITLISKELSINNPTFKNVINYLIDNNYNITKLKDLKKLVHKKEVYNKLYLKLNNKQIKLLCEYYSINYSNKKYSLWELVDNYNKVNLTKTIQLVNKKIEREKLFNKLKETTDPTLLKTLCLEFSKIDKCDKNKLLNYLVDNYSEESINNILNNEKCRKIKLSNELNNKLYTNSMHFLLNYYGIPAKNKQETIEYLVNNFTSNQIDYMFYTTKILFKKDSVKRNPINGKYILEEYSEEEIKKHLDSVYNFKDIITKQE